MTNEEMALFAAAVNKLKEDGKWDSIYKIHEQTHEAHRTDIFLPWHRRFILDVETMIQEAAVESGVPALEACKIGMPYWNWAMEEGNVRGSEVFSDARYGAGHFDSEKAMPVTDGLFGKDSPFQASINRGASRRRGVAKEHKIVPASWLEILAQLDSGDAEGRDIGGFEDYSSMTMVIEGEFHNSVHGAIGGHMSNMSSPFDPLFFLHHTFVDYMWKRWQDINVDRANASQLRHDLVPRALQGSPDAHYVSPAQLDDPECHWVDRAEGGSSGHFGEGAHPDDPMHTKTCFKAQEVSDPMRQLDDDTSTRGSEYACVRYADEAAPPQAACAQDWNEISSCMTLALWHKDFKNIPRVVNMDEDVDVCDPVSKEKVADSTDWLGVMEKEGMLNESQMVAAMDAEAEDAARLARLLKQPAVEAVDDCEKALCFSVTTLLTRCRDGAYTTQPVASPA